MAYEKARTRQGKQTKWGQATAYSHQVQYPCGSEGYTVPPGDAAERSSDGQTEKHIDIHLVHAREVHMAKTDKQATHKWLVDGKMDAQSEAILVPT